jgi:arylsulfatase
MDTIISIRGRAKRRNPPRQGIFYYDETDLMAFRVDGWEMHIGVKMRNNWFDPKSYPSVSYIVNLLMDPMEKMTPDSEECGYVGRAFLPTIVFQPYAYLLSAVFRIPAQP